MIQSYSQSRHRTMVGGVQCLAFSLNWFVNIGKENPDRRADPRSLLALSRMCTRQTCKMPCSSVGEQSDPLANKRWGVPLENIDWFTSGVSFAADK